MKTWCRSLSRKTSTSVLPSIPALATPSTGKLQDLKNVLTSLTSQASRSEGRESAAGGQLGRDGTLDPP